MAKEIKLYFFNHNWPPVHYIQMAIPKGSFFEPLEKKGITEILAQNLLLFSQKYPGKPLKALFNQIGANYEISVLEESFVITLKVTEENLEKGFSLLMDCFLFPEFNKIKFKSSKKTALGNLKIALTDPQVLSEYHLFDLAFGKNHPLGKNQTPATIKSINFKDLGLEFEKLKDTKNWGIYISSLWQREKVEGVLQDALKNYEIKNLNSYNLEKINFKEKSKVRIVPKKDLTQVAINLLIPAPSRKSEDYLPLKISFYSFAEGGFSARILKKIRVEMASTYGVLGSYDAFKEVGFFQIFGMIKNDDFKKTVEIIQEMYKSWREEGITEEELEEAKSFYFKSFNAIKDDPLDWGSFLLKNHIYNFPENYDEILLEKLKNIKLEDVTIAHKNLAEEIPFWCLLGDENILKPVASSLGEVEIKNYFDFE